MDNLEISLNEAVQVAIDKQRRLINKTRDSWERDKATLTLDEMRLAGDVMLLCILEQNQLIDDLWEMCKDGS